MSQNVYETLHEYPLQNTQVTCSRSKHFPLPLAGTGSIQGADAGVLMQNKGSVGAGLQHLGSFRFLENH